MTQPDHTHPADFRLTSEHLDSSHPGGREAAHDAGMTPKRWHKKVHEGDGAAHPPRDRGSEIRMLALGFLTAAANALTMGGSADDFARERVRLAMGLLNHVQGPDRPADALSPSAEGTDTPQDVSGAEVSRGTEPYEDLWVAPAFPPAPSAVQSGEMEHPESAVLRCVHCWQHLGPEHRVDEASPAVIVAQGVSLCEDHARLTYDAVWG